MSEVQSPMSNVQSPIAKVQWGTKDAEPDDPMELVGVLLPAEAETLREMAYVFAEEFARMGYDRGDLLALFRNPRYAGAYGAYRGLGEKRIQAIIDECVKAWRGD